MSKDGGGLRVRVKTARRRTAQSTRWLDRQLNDPYVKRAKAEGYRSRAAYKLIELDERFGFLRGVKRVVDLGIAPGGWSQVVRRRSPKIAIVGIDLLPVDPIDDVVIFQMDFMDDAAPGKLTEALGGAPDLVLSDMAANTVGHPQTDALRTMALVEAAPGLRGRCAGAGRGIHRQGLRRRRRCVVGRRAEAQLQDGEARQAPASRKGSSEWYVVAQGFKGGGARRGRADPSAAQTAKSPRIAPRALLFVR